MLLSTIPFSSSSSSRHRHRNRNMMCLMILMTKMTAHSMRELLRLRISGRRRPRSIVVAHHAHRRYDRKIRALLLLVPATPRRAGRRHRYQSAERAADEPPPWPVPIDSLQLAMSRLQVIVVTLQLLREHAHLLMLMWAAASAAVPVCAASSSVGWKRSGRRATMQPLPSSNGLFLRPVSVMESRSRQGPPELPWPAGVMRIFRTMARC
mmetsp:Transcript_21303/g.46448  ORF Transcript_21303/g.46448 Transcript_21303/m.46448 type:complete len:209 (-) Transcript_21303:451-1077(-)